MNLNFKALANPLLILSDAAEQLTGLARIGRDIASLASTMPEFRVGYLGRGGFGRRKFPWVQYPFPEAGQWGEEYIEDAWNDFSNGQDGIVLSTWDASRMLWFGQPGNLQTARPDLARFLGPGRNFAKWGYFAVDGVGPNESSLSVGSAAAVAGYDRVLAASDWGSQILSAGGRADADWLPHGVFFDKFAIDEDFKPDAKKIVVGCNMANQSRKDWPVAFEAAAVLKQEYGNKLHCWFHTDRVVHYWNLYALATDYGVGDSIEITLDLTDADLARRYSACDCTILPSAGEGFGYPIAESRACGTACVVTDYAAGQELVDLDCRVAPVTYRVDTQHNVRRAVLSGYAFAAKAKGQIEKKREDWQYQAARNRDAVSHLDWNKLKVQWEKWLRTGLLCT